MAKFESLMKKISNRHFEYEGKMFTEKGFVRYIGFRNSRTDKHIHGSGYQDINLDINDKTRQVTTEIDSSVVEYNLTEDEYCEFKNELQARIA